MKSGSGYEYIYKDGKPTLKGRAVMEEYLGRPLKKEEVVGYVNGDRTDCRIENLYLCLRTGIPLDKLICKNCGAHGNFTVKTEK